MQKCRIIVYIYAIAWYMQLYLIHIGLYDIFVYCVYCEFIVIHLIFAHMCATQFHQCLALSVAFCWLWPVTYAKGHQQQHFINNKNCADAHVSSVLSIGCTRKVSHWLPPSSDRNSTRQPQPPQQRWPRRLPPPGSCFSKTSLIETRFKVKCIHWWTL